MFFVGLIAAFAAGCFCGWYKASKDWSKLFNEARDFYSNKIERLEKNRENYSYSNGKYGEVIFRE